jgi:5'-AMP-activated protein kinase catalytic alpha subunit
MIAGKRYNGLSVDIWSTGIIMFALICGYLPFEDSNTSALYKKIMAGEFAIPKFVSPEARDLLKKILNTDPAKRNGIAEIRAHAWYLQESESLNVPQQGIIVGRHAIPIDE